MDKNEDYINISREKKKTSKSIVQSRHSMKNQ